ncbi:hypothetical protein ACLBPG_23665, partial [Klebsiella pneumoniae]
DVFAGKKSAQIREILISESAWEEMTCLFAPSLDFSLFFQGAQVTNKNQFYLQISRIYGERQQGQHISP